MNQYWSILISVIILAIVSLFFFRLAVRCQTLHLLYLIPLYLILSFVIISPLDEYFGKLIWNMGYRWKMSHDSGITVMLLILALIGFSLVTVLVAMIRRQMIKDRS